MKFGEYNLQDAMTFYATFRLNILNLKGSQVIEVPRIACILQPIQSHFIVDRNINDRNAFTN